MDPSGQQETTRLSAEYPPRRKILQTNSFVLQKMSGSSAKSVTWCFHVTSSQQWLDQHKTQSFLDFNGSTGPKLLGLRVHLNGAWPVIYGP